MASATEIFPRVTRTRTFEASVAGKRKLDALPVNLGVNYEITDNYIGFRIPGTTEQFLDLSSLVLVYRKDEPYD